MIYFDNAATTRKKPQIVIEAFESYLLNIGVSPGRGSYSVGVEASRMLYKSRMTVADYFGLSDPNVVFTKNSTEAINLFFRGFLKTGDHVIISTYEHNAVLRPLEKMKEEGIIDYSIISRDDMLLSPEELLNKYVKSNTVLLALTLASNLTGRIVFRKELFKRAKENGLKTFLDSSQGAGYKKIRMIEDSIDYLAFTGHKDLKGLPGVGGLCSVDVLEFVPLIQGGTGVLGHEKTNPHVFPEGYEAGTLNMPAIWALKNAIDFIQNNQEEIESSETRLTDYLLSALKDVPNIIIYDENFERIGTVGFNIKGYSSNDIVKVLDESKICVRGGIHCAILTHESLNTVSSGVVRVSLSNDNTIEEIDELVEVLGKLEQKNVCDVF